MSDAKFIFHSDLIAKLNKYRAQVREDFMNIEINTLEDLKFEKGVLEGVDRMTKFLENSFID